MSIGQITKKESKEFEKRPRVCELCGKPGNDYNPLILHHCYFRSQASPEISEKNWNWALICARGCHQNGKDSVHSNQESADFMRERADARREGTLIDNPLIY